MVSPRLQVNPTPILQSNKKAAVKDICIRRKHILILGASKILQVIGASLDRNTSYGTSLRLFNHSFFQLLIFLRDMDGWHLQLSKYSCCGKKVCLPWTIEIQVRVPTVVSFGLNQHRCTVCGSTEHGGTGSWALPLKAQHSACIWCIKTYPGFMQHIILGVCKTI